MLRAHSWILLLTSSLLAPATAEADAVTVTTQHNDIGRTGANLNETILTTSDVNVQQFGRLFACAVDGHIYAQPLYVPQVTIPLKGLHNVVYVATEHNSVYAFDADDCVQSTPLWHVDLGAPRPAGFPTKYGIEQGIQIEIGITSTPVIDLASQTLYVVTYTQDSAAGPFRYKLHALDLGTGVEKFGGPIEIIASTPGPGDGNVGGTLTLNPAMHMQRPSLLLLNGQVYVSFGSFADSDPYHGWVVSYNAATLARIAVFNTTPDGGEGAIWMSGQGLLGDASGNVFFMVGNGSTTASSGGSSYGNSFIKLAGNNLSLLDWFMPYNAESLANADLDVGSSGPVLIPGTSLLVGGGKQGILYLIDTKKMGNFNASGDTQIVQKFQASDDEIFNTPVFWNNPSNPLLFLWPQSQGLKAFSFNNGLFNTTPVAQNNTITPSQPGGTLSISANANAPGTGIVWATHSTAGSAETVAQPGELHAYDASNITTEIWNSLQNPARDDLGLYGKFTPPSIANGKVYVATFSGWLNVYGLVSSSVPVLNGQTLLTAQTPAPGNYTDGPYELGLKIVASHAGQLTAIRYWKTAGETGPHFGHVWSNTGTLLASATFANETASGWQQAALNPPLAISAAQTYVVSVNSKTAYGATNNALATSVTNGFLSTVADGKNGVYGAPGSFPTSSYKNTNYFRDAVFVPSGSQSILTTQSPSLVGLNDSTTYELGMKFTSTQAGQVVAIKYWKDIKENGVHIGRLWDASRRELGRATFTNETASGWQTAYLNVPVAILPNTEYVISVNTNAYYVATNEGLNAPIANESLSTIADGANGVYGDIGHFPASTYQNANYFRDLLFVPNSNNGTTTSSVFTTQTPAASYNDGPYEMGMKFQATTAGQLLSIRYYKDPSETGVHTGRIWSAAGVQLASVPFTNEWASGWQTATLTTPLALAGSTTYVVSVNSNSRYDATNSGLSTPINNGDLSSVADGADGVYGAPGTFPTNSYQNSNYFRDLTFQSN
jgi:Domain of unknown function (DUF4082)